MGPSRAERSVSAAQAAAFRLSRQHLAGSTPHGATSMRHPAASTQRHARPTRQIGRSSEHVGASTGHVARICRDTGGIQAQVMSAAELSIWTRRRESTREEIQKALWETREIVRTSAMRMTLHLIPARDLPIYVAAMKAPAFRRIEYWLRRMGATPQQVQTMVGSVVDSLADGSPRTQQELVASAK